MKAQKLGNSISECHFMEGKERNRPAAAADTDPASHQRLPTHCTTWNDEVFPAGGCDIKLHTYDKAAFSAGVFTLCVHAYVCSHTCTHTYLEHKHTCGPRGQAQVIMLGSEHFYPPRHLVGPIFYIPSKGNFRSLYFFPK